MHLRYKSLFLLLCSISFSARADELYEPFENPAFDIIGTAQTEIKTMKILADGTHATKKISLNTILPSEIFLEKHWDFLSSVDFTTAELDYSKGIIPFSQSPGAVDLGMVNVPVLDQGSEGTCVTFAATAAMDAVLKQGDFISQQCSLELDLALGQYYWSGARFPAQIIEPLKVFGLVEQGNCNETYPNPWGYITLWDYMSRASKTIDPKSISYKYKIWPSLNVVKSALNSGHRMVIAFAMSALTDSIVTNGFDMNINGTKTSGGLWACEQPSSPTNYCTLLSAGHAVVVIGYDDTQQLLKIRNSWNTDVGDNGDYYMTYTYFNAMNSDGTEVY